ncbi:MAG: hypothetical protein A3E78_06950 [Alphaproteobacteria bacterium RIFCSPHIGHO2_12_FULL_63_12]|nr:MAG: hypothetical protein A3E78_06950 [Alphaproteobacteria bacterium RIFCSPHIGHO2_12_FULL_63_12]
MQAEAARAAFRLNFSAIGFFKKQDSGTRSRAASKNQLKPRANVGAFCGWRPRQWSKNRQPQ